MAGKVQKQTERRQNQLKVKEEPKSEPEPEPKSQRSFKAKAFVALEELSLGHCSLWLPLATC